MDEWSILYSQLNAIFPTKKKIKCYLALVALFFDQAHVALLKAPILNFPFELAENMSEHMSFGVSFFFAYIFSEC